MKRFEIKSTDGVVIEGVFFDDGFVHVRAPENVMSMSMQRDVWDQMKDSFFTNGFTYKEVD